MSTRNNIILKHGKDLFQIYHHCDGYWEGVGVDLLKYFTSEFEWPETIVLSDIVSELESWDDQFEPEPDCLELHGDIEYAYIVEFCKEGVSMNGYIRFLKI